tara:strand:+ start:152 stop:658 length:507 start_codon:yes stop_codon:yes gene_type:complete
MKRFLGVFWILMAVCPEVVATGNTMDKLIEQLKRHEGVKHFPYRDSVGVLTIGCGRNISTSKKHKGIGLSISEIEFLLENDIVRTIKELAGEYPWFNDLEEGARRDAIINMHFNLGRVRFASFKMALYHMEKGRHQDASSEFLNSKWAKQVKGRALEITDMISTNTYV